ncbi:hypothetical protein ABH973_000926 [Bradyrhizobium ottawaense]
MRLVLFDKNEHALAEVASGLQADVRHLAGEVTRFEDLERLRDLAVSAFGKSLC